MADEIALPVEAEFFKDVCQLIARGIGRNAERASGFLQRQTARQLAHKPRLRRRKSEKRGRQHLFIETERAGGHEKNRRRFLLERSGKRQARFRQLRAVEQEPENRQVAGRMNIEPHQPGVRAISYRRESLLECAAVFARAPGQRRAFLKRAREGAKLRGHRLIETQKASAPVERQKGRRRRAGRFALRHAFFGKARGFFQMAGNFGEKVFGQALFLAVHKLGETQEIFPVFRIGSIGIKTGDHVGEKRIRRARLLPFAVAMHPPAYRCAAHPLVLRPQMRRLTMAADMRSRLRRKKTPCYPAPKQKAIPLGMAF